MAAPSPLVQAVSARLALHPELDPRAVLGIAAHEGLSGGIGDNGTSYGPFQLHQGGALPAAVGARGAQAAQQWATSPAGIDYALNAISKVAGGLKGLPAIQAISTKFERPANPQAEISDAARHYGIAYAGGSSAAAPGVAPGPSAQAPRGQSPVLAALRFLGFNPGSAFKQPAAPTLPTGSPAAAPATPFKAGAEPGHGIAELLLEGTGGPTHSTGPHVHAAFTDPNAELAAIKEADALGLHVGENPYVGSLSPSVHAPHSFHKVDFPGLYNGRKLGEAIDVSGPAQDAFYQWLAKQRR